MALIAQENRKARAENPETKPRQLAVLSRDSSREVRRAVARNPNTSLNVLFRLASEFPDEFLRNPVVGLLHLMEPHFYQKISVEAWLSILRSKEAPGHWVRWIIASVWNGNLKKLPALESALLHRKASEEAREAHRIKNTWEINRYTDWVDGLAIVIQHERTPLPLLRELFSHQDRRLRYAVLKNPAVPQDLLVQCISDRDFMARMARAQQPATPPEELKKLAADGSQEVKIAVLRHHAVPQKVLARLATHRKPLIRQAVAENTRTPEETLAQLASDQDEEVRKSVASNPATPGEVLAQLAVPTPYVRNWVIRENVAQNPATPEEVLAQLAVDENATVRYRALNNPVVLKKQREPESSSSNDASGPAADGDTGSRRDTHLLLVKNQAIRYREDIWSPGFSQATLERLATHADQGVSSVARRRLEKRLYIEKHDAREFVARRRAGKISYPISKYELLLEIEYIAQFPYGQTFEGFFNALEAPDDLRQELIKQCLHYYITEQTERTLPYRNVRWSNKSRAENWIWLLQHLDMLLEWQKYFVLSPYWWERYLVAVNPKAQISILQTLADDGNRYVSQVAQWYLQEQQYCS